MYSSESYVYKGIRVKSHRATTHLFLEKYDSSRNSSSLGKAVIFGCHGHTRLVSVPVLHRSRPVAGWRTVQWGRGPLEGELGGLCSGPSSDANKELRASETGVLHYRSQSFPAGTFHGDYLNTRDLRPFKGDLACETTWY